MKIAFVDDDKFYDTYFKDALKKCQLDISYDYYNDPNLFLENAEIYDLVFLDIEFKNAKLPEGLKLSGYGFYVAHCLRNIKPDILIIYVTNHDSLVYEAFGMNIIGFLKKGNMERFLPYLWKKVLLENSLLQEITITNLHSHEVERILLKNISACSIFGRTVTIYLKDGDTRKIRKDSLSQFLEELNCPYFVYANRSAIINARLMITYDKSGAMLSGVQKEIPIGRRYYEDVQRAFFKRSMF